MGLPVLLQFLFILLWLAAVATSTLPIAKPNCSDKCGNITVPYPFGFGARECYRDERFQRTCNDNYKPPKLLLWNFEVLNLSLEGQERVLAYISRDCYNKSGYRTSSNIPSAMQNLSIFTFSDTQNKFTALGCDTKAYIEGSGGRNFTSGCSMICDSKSDVIDGSCTGIGCCQTSIPKGFRKYQISLQSFHNHIEVFDFNPCSYAFLVDKDWYNFSISNLLNYTNSVDETGFSQVPVVFDWAVDNKTCEEAMENQATYACHNNSHCIVSKNGVGYNCNCSKGYEGNPYLPDGCQDIDECADPTKNDCVSICTNLPGNYTCSCPPGYDGEGKKDGIGCIKPPFPVIPVTIGTGMGFLFLLIGSLFVLYALQKRKQDKQKQKFFEQNGGLLLKNQLSSLEGDVEAAKIYTAKELNEATKNYAQSQILGQGGHGIVYQGILPNRRTVAIKKSKIGDDSQIKQLINEVFILSQINHRNVVKLLGCCLETEIPIFVYEFVTNKTLFHHIHGEGRNSPISWDDRLRIAAETSEALAYLHFEVSPPIIHRDVKSANILLDDDYTAKVSDFGVSRLIPLKQTKNSTLVQGTLGYLDPEYIQTTQLTEKSDVYSFGIVIVELLTGKEAVYSDRLGRETNLAMHFVTSIKEGRVWDILDGQIKTEGCEEQLQEVLNLAERCLRVKREERPTMMEVKMKLQELRRDEKHHRVV